MTAVSTHSSPLQALQAQLSSSISSGAIESADKDALTTALTDIDSSLDASRGEGSKGKPGDVKQKVDDLIAQQVSSGTLTSDQANELKGVFEQTFSQNGPAASGGASGPGGPGGAGGPGGPGGPHGAGGPPPKADDGDDSSDTTTSSTSSASDLLQQFLKSLQEQLNAGASTYSASGTETSTSSAFGSLVVNYTT